jgi:hypothetical protein
MVPGALHPRRAPDFMQVEGASGNSSFVGLRFLCNLPRVLEVSAPALFV